MTRLVGPMLAALLLAASCPGPAPGPNLGGSGGMGGSSSTGGVQSTGGVGLSPTERCIAAKAASASVQNVARQNGVAPSTLAAQMCADVLILREYEP